MSIVTFTRLVVCASMLACGADGVAVAWPLKIAAPFNRWHQPPLERITVPSPLDTPLLPTNLSPFDHGVLPIPENNKIEVSHGPPSSVPLPESLVEARASATPSSSRSDPGEAPCQLGQRRFVTDGGTRFCPLVPQRPLEDFFSDEDGLQPFLEDAPSHY